MTNTHTASFKFQPDTESASFKFQPADSKGNIFGYFSFVFSYYFFVVVVVVVFSLQ